MSNELQALAGMAASVDSQHAEPVYDEQGQPVQEPMAPDYMTEARGAVDMFAALVVGYAPKAEHIWSEATKGRVAGALAPVMEKYNFSFGALPPELTLIIVAGPVLWQTSKVVAAQMENDKAQQAKTQATDATVKREEPHRPAAKPTGQPEQAPAAAVHPQTALYGG